MSRAKVAMLLALVAAAPQVALAAGSRPLTPAENRYQPWTGEVPACDTPRVLREIKVRFAQSESEFWKSGLDMAGFNRFREIGYRTLGADAIPRRYCTAQALFNDGKTRQVTYWIGEDLGFAGGDFFGLLTFSGRTNVFNNWGVTFCVNGLDRNYAYGQGCSAARP